MGTKPSRIKLRTGRGADSVDAAGFADIMKDNWDSIKEDIKEMNEEERAAALSNLNDKIPDGKELLELMYREDSEVEEFLEAI